MVPKRQLILAGPSPGKIKGREQGKRQHGRCQHKQAVFKLLKSIPCKTMDQVMVIIFMDPFVGKPGANKGPDARGYSTQTAQGYKPAGPLHDTYYILQGIQMLAMLIHKKALCNTK